MKLDDYSSIEFKNVKELYDYVNNQKKNDVWLENFIFENKVICLEENELMIQQYINDYNIQASKEDILATMKDTGLFVCLPLNDQMVCYPVRYTAVTSLFERAGLAGRTLKATNSTPHMKFIGVQRKGEIITECMSLYDTKAKILIRDGKISAMLSEKYSVLPASELISSLDYAITNYWGDSEFLSGEASHEYLIVEYGINDKDAENYLSKALKTAGFNFDTVKAGIIFATSDIGNSNACVYPYFVINQRRLRCGLPLGLRHASEHGIEDWENLLERLGSLMRQCADNISKLANLKLKYPSSCLYHIGKEINLPMAPLMETVEQMEAEVMNATALDVYYYLTGAIDLYEENSAKEVTPTKRLELQESIAQTLFWDFRRFDYPRDLSNN